MNAEAEGRSDRWKDKATNRWTGKVFVALDPGEGSLRSKGIAADAASLKRRELRFCCCARWRSSGLTE